MFDWAVSTDHHHAAARHTLALRLARVIQRVALTADEAASFAIKPDVQAQPFDTYVGAVTARWFPASYDSNDRARPFLPTRLFDPEGPWVPIHGSTPLSQHADEMSRSHFGVFLHVPGGRRPTLEYLRGLWNSSEPFAVDPSAGELRTSLSPRLRPMPIGTQLALVRRMLFIDASGEIRFSSIVESIQIRVFRAPITPPPHIRRLGGRYDQDFFEFVLDRNGLVTDPSTALRAVTATDEDFLTFSSHGIDPFEHTGLVRATRTLAMCVACHHDEGLASVLSNRRLFKPYAFVTGFRSALDGNATFWKSQRADWGRLQVYWKMEAR